jgi:peptidyl-prolyl cis-trans isomerase D
MITWMQRHKKWLIITIWISAIAFIGAGFVGWGSYNYGQKQGTVAVVGDREVSYEEFQREYSYLYDQYRQMFGEQFNDEVAKQLNLSEMAYNMVIQKNLILSHADELRLDVTQEEVAKELLTMDAFYKDGKFNKEIYVQVLAQNRTTPTEFEASLKRDLLLDKVNQIFALKPTSQEIQNMAQLLFLEDDINIEVMNINDIKLNTKEEELKEYFQANASNYMSLPAYELKTTTMDFIQREISQEEIEVYYEKNKNDFKKDNGILKTVSEAKEDIVLEIKAQESKKEALKLYLDLKKEVKSFEDTKTFFENKLPYALEEIQTISASKQGEVLKPFLHNNQYVIVKINKKIEPQPLSFEDAYTMVKNDYEQTQRQIQIAQTAAQKLENFEGKAIGFVNRTSTDAIEGLNQEQAAQFLSQLFEAKEPKGFFQIGDNVVLYKINDSRLGSVDAQKQAMVQSSLENLLSNELMTNLINDMENRTQIQSSLQKDK